MEPRDPSKDSYKDIVADRAAREIITEYDSTRKSGITSTQYIESLGRKHLNTRTCTSFSQIVEAVHDVSARLLVVDDDMPWMCEDSVFSNGFYVGLEFARRKLGESFDDTTIVNLEQIASLAAQMSGNDHKQFAKIVKDFSEGADLRKLLAGERTDPSQYPSVVIADTFSKDLFSDKRRVNNFRRGVNLAHVISEV